MKKLLLGSLLIVGITGFTATTGTLQLQGIVPAVLALTVTSEPSATSLDLSTTQTDLKVATITEESNSASGYKITVSSANDGDFKRNSGAETFTYSLKYGSTTLNLVGSSVTPVTAKTQSTSGVYNVNTDIDISYTGVSLTTLVAGTYQDILTFEISAN